MQHAIYIPQQRLAVVYESATEHGARREVCRRIVPVAVWRRIVRLVAASAGPDTARAERLAEVATNLAEPEALETFRRVAGCAAFNVKGHVRRIANGSAVSYVFRDGSRFVVSDACGYHAAIDRDGENWAQRPAACVARGAAR